MLFNKMEFDITKRNYKNLEDLMNNAEFIIKDNKFKLNTEEKIKVFWNFIFNYIKLFKKNNSNSKKCEEHLYELNPFIKVLNEYLKQMDLPFKLEKMQSVYKKKSNFCTTELLFITPNFWDFYKFGKISKGRIKKSFMTTSVNESKSKITIYL